MFLPDREPGYYWAQVQEIRGADSAPKLWRERENAELLQLRAGGTLLAYAILADFKENDPEILKANERDIASKFPYMPTIVEASEGRLVLPSSFELRWGRKVNFTDFEKGLLARSYDEAYSGLVPDEISGPSYDFIRINFHNEGLGIEEFNYHKQYYDDGRLRFEYRALLDEPRPLLEVLSHAVQNPPSHEYEVIKRRGKDYWVEPPAPKSGLFARVLSGS